MKSLTGENDINLKLYSDALPYIYHNLGKWLKVFSEVYLIGAVFFDNIRSSFWERAQCCYLQFNITKMFSASYIITTILQHDFCLFLKEIKSWFQIFQKQTKNIKWIYLMVRDSLIFLYQLFSSASGRTNSLYILFLGLFKSQLMLTKH